MGTWPSSVRPTTSPSNSFRPTARCRPRNLGCRCQIPGNGRKSGLVRPPDRLYKASRCAHRLAVQDTALSRREQGFDSPWARHLSTSAPDSPISVSRWKRRRAGIGERPDAFGALDQEPIREISRAGTSVKPLKGTSAVAPPKAENLFRRASMPEVWHWTKPAWGPSTYVTSAERMKVVRAPESRRYRREPACGPDRRQ